MTKASANRAARRAAAGPPVFRRPPDGMFSEQVDLEAFGLSLGLIHPDGSPILVAVWDGRQMRRLLPEQAATWADELVSAGQAVPLAPVISALRGLVKKAADVAMASLSAETMGNA